MTAIELRAKHSVLSRTRHILVGPGWFGIVDDLCTCLAMQAPGIVITEIREVLGGLLVKYDHDTVQPHATALVGDLLAVAKVLSTRTCELCGNAGDRVASPLGWQETRCDDCAGATGSGRPPRPPSPGRTP